MTTTQATVASAQQELEKQVANLQRALENSRLIGIAVGILMARLHLTREDAFEVLRAASQRTNRKVADLAADVANYGDLLEHQPHAGNSYGQPRRS